MSRKLFRTATLGAASITAVLAFGVTGASAATVDGADVPCQQTGLVRDGSNLTAAVKDPTASVSVDVDATGCDIGVYYGSGTSGSVNGADIQGAKYYGIVVNAAVVEVDGAKIHDIGDTPIGANNPLKGMQRGVGVLYTTLDQANEVKYQNGDQSWVKTTGTRTGVAKGHIKDSVIEDYQKNGVVVSGPGRLRDP